MTQEMVRMEPVYSSDKKSEHEVWSNGIIQL